MNTSTSPCIRRSDYSPYPFAIETTTLRIELNPHRTLVHSRLKIRRFNPSARDCRLDGFKLETLSITIDGTAAAEGAYRIEPNLLTIVNPPDQFVLETQVAIDPESNTALTGLYRSKGTFFTQCEAEGFRRITWYADRPDVLSRFETTLIAPSELAPVLLSNGNQVAIATLPDGRKSVTWKDPFPKPCYLFAIVAGQLSCIDDTFMTRSGRRVQLEVWSRAEDLQRCWHAMKSLKAAMRWDEIQYGREYDLDLYMIVAAADFNMGAMENKGLNIFNAALVMASPETATDGDYDRIEGVIAHEYFHNWTGNRVTCRDWFQLTLKEGLTVFRDQTFSESMGPGAVKRIDDVRLLRTRQFAEDAGPLRHPIRPEEYQAIDNFYTVTVYEKGAEIIRMYETLLGTEGFRKGMDLYFSRHDGQAVTCDDFRRAMADANGKNLDQFEEWYKQAGTPIVSIKQSYDPATSKLTLDLEQRNPVDANLPPLLIPLTFGAIGRASRKALDFGDGNDSLTVELNLKKMRLTVNGNGEEPVLSPLRGLSAPVILEYAQSAEDLAFLLAYDTDPFNRWDAGQRLAAERIFAALKGTVPCTDLSVGWQTIFEDDSLDGSFRAQCASLPGLLELLGRMDPTDPAALHAAREQVQTGAAAPLRPILRKICETTGMPAGLDRKSRDARRLRNHALGLWASLGDDEAFAVAGRQFATANTMTDSLAALSILCRRADAQRENALAHFETRWKSNDLVMDKWFAVQASSDAPDTLERIEVLSKHPAFTLSNPNRMRSLVATFANNNPVWFHHPSLRGHAFVTRMTAATDQLNPQVAARLATVFNPWRRYVPHLGNSMRSSIETLLAAKPSRDTKEILERALKG